MNNALSKQAHLLSHWGKLHAGPARLLIAVGHFLLAGIALTLGAIWLPYQGKMLLVVQLLLFATAGAIAICYPEKRKNLKQKACWARRKKAEGSMLVCGFLLLLLTGPALRESKLHLSMVPAYASAVQHAPAKDTQTRVGGFLQNLKQRYLEASDAVKMLLALLALAAAIATGFGIIGLACNLSCSGYEVAAVLVFFGGGALLLTGLVTIIVRLFESKQRAEKRSARQLQRRQKREEAQKF